MRKPVKPKREVPRKPGRPPNIKLDELERLGQLQPTQPEVAAYFGVTLNAVERALAKPVYRDAYERGREKGKLSLRRAQIQVADAGNPTMLIWLGKNILGQKDEVTTVHDGTLALTDETNRDVLRSKLVGRLAGIAGRDRASGSKA